MKAFAGCVQGLLIIAAVNWGLIGLLGLDLLDALYGRYEGYVRLINVLLGLAGLWGIYLIYPLVRGTSLIPNEGSLLAQRRRHQT